MSAINYVDIDNDFLFLHRKFRKLFSGNSFPSKINLYFLRKIFLNAPFFF